MFRMDDSEYRPDPSERLERLGIREGDYYFSKEGYMVFTEQYHLRRGYCCQSGCRHCPFDRKEPKEATD